MDKIKTLKEYFIAGMIGLGSLTFSGCSNKIYENVIELVKKDGQTTETYGADILTFQKGDKIYSLNYYDEKRGEEGLVLLVMSVMSEEGPHAGFYDYEANGMKTKKDGQFIFKADKNGNVTILGEINKENNKREFRKMGKDYKSLMKEIPEMYTKSKR